jgi:hypothetical protein
MHSPVHRGFTIDVFGGLGIGYRNYRQKWETNPDFDAVFEKIRKNKLTIPVRLGISIGYAF